MPKKTISFSFAGAPALWNCYRRGAGPTEGYPRDALRLNPTIVQPKTHTAAVSPEEEQQLKAEELETTRRLRAKRGPRNAELCPKACENE